MPLNKSRKDAKLGMDAACAKSIQRRDGEARKRDHWVRVAKEQHAHKDSGENTGKNKTR